VIENIDQNALTSKFDKEFSKTPNIFSNRSRMETSTSECFCCEDDYFQTSLL